MNIHKKHQDYPGTGILRPRTAGAVSTSTAVAIATIALILAACGGATETRGGPLKHHFQPRYIASIDIEDKQAILDARDAYARAEMAYDKAVTEVEDSRVELRVARNEVEQKKLAVKSCKERQNAADKCYEIKRSAAATDEVSAAQHGLATARARLTYLKGHLAYLSARRDHLRQVQYVAEADIELERARLAMSKDIQPPGATVAEFEGQRAQRSDYARELAAVAESKRATSEEHRVKWEGMQQPAPAQAPALAEPPTPAPAEPPGS